MTPDLSDLSPEYLVDLESQGLSNLKLCGLDGLKRYNFTWGLITDIQPLGHGRRYCYETFEEARDALAAWSGDGHPSGAWIKCKGANIDLLNPMFGAEHSR
jgi:hypothetical protein